MVLPKGYVRSNDEVAEPFQPMPTREKWTKQDLWDNRAGTVIRSGLYLKYRRLQDAEVDVIRKNLEKETQERVQSDKELNDRADDLQGQIDIIGDWRKPLADEVDARKAGDDKLTTALNNEIKIRSDQVAKLEGDVSQEIRDRADGDFSLGQKLTQEENQRIAGDEALQTSITEEETARKAGDKVNKELIDGLETSLGTAAFVNTGNEPGNVPLVQSDGKLDNVILPSITTNHTYVVSSEEEMLALSDAVVGDVAVREDTRETFILKALPPSVLENWIPLSHPTDVVTSWNGKTGAVTYTPPVESVNGQTGKVKITVNGQSSGSDGNIGLAGEILPVTYEDGKTIKDALDEKASATDLSKYVTLSTAQTITGSKTYEAVQIFKTTPGSGLQSALGVVLRDDNATDVQRQTLLWMNPKLPNQTSNGFTFGIGMGANAILGGGESARSLLNAILDKSTTPPALVSGVNANGGTENGIVVGDTNVFIGSGYQNGGTTGKWWTFGNDGRLLAPDGVEYAKKGEIDGSKLVTIDTEQAITGKKAFKAETSFKAVISPNDPRSSSSLAVRQTKPDGSDGQLIGLVKMNPQLNETANGFSVGFGANGNTIIGGGESHIALLKAIEKPETTPPALSAVSATKEHAILVADNDAYIGSNYNGGSGAPTSGNWWKFGADGKAHSPSGGNLVDTDTEQTFTAPKAWGEIVTTGKGEEGQITTVAPDGSITQIQKVAGSNEYTEVYIANGHVQARTLLTDGTPQQTAFLSGHGLTQTNNIDWTTITERQNGFSGGSIQIKRYNNVVTIIGDNITCPAVAQWGTKTLFNIPAKHVNKKNMYGAVYLSKYTATYHVDSNGQFIVSFPVASTTAMHAGFTLTYVI